jgi:hypothetical protein
MHSQFPKKTKDGIINQFAIRGNKVEIKAQLQGCPNVPDQGSSASSHSLTLYLALGTRRQM